MEIDSAREESKRKKITRNYLLLALMMSLGVEAAPSMSVMSPSIFIFLGLWLSFTVWGVKRGRKVNRGGEGGHFGEESGILIIVWESRPRRRENNTSKRKLFPEKSNPRVREEGHLCLFGSPSAQCPYDAVPRIYQPHSPPSTRVLATPTYNIFFLSLFTTTKYSFSYHKFIFLNIIF